MEKKWLMYILQIHENILVLNFIYHCYHNISMNNIVTCKWQSSMVFLGEWHLINVGWFPQNDDALAWNHFLCYWPSHGCIPLTKGQWWCVCVCVCVGGGLWCFVWCRGGGGLWCFISGKPKQTVEQTVNLPVSWDAFMFMWNHCNELPGHGSVHWVETWGIPCENCLKRAWWHQAINWTNIDLLSKVVCDIHLRAISHKVLWNLIYIYV